MTPPMEPDSVPAETDSAIGAAEFEAVLNAAVDGIIVSDHNGTILRYNQAAEKLFGYTPGEIVGQSINVIMNPDDAETHGGYLKKYLRTGKRRIIGIGREVMARRKNGSTFPVALSIGEVKLGDKLRFVGLIRDLTAERQAEEEARRQREQMMHVSRLTTMGEMAATMAHELNQPLSAIATYTAACVRLLEKDEDHRQDVVSALGEIGAQAHRAAEVIQRMRDFTRSREHSHTLVSVTDLVREILPLAELDAWANQVRLDVNVAKDLPSVVVDAIQIQQVILNLLRNGVDAMTDTPEADRQLRLNAFPVDDERIRVEISDHGHGISEVSQNQLFTPFFTTKETGMGMGLAISRSIINAHGGKLDCENNSGPGAKFFFTLPTSVKNQKNA